MAGQLDSLLKSVAKDVVSTLGSALDTSITYTKKASGSYNTSTGVYTTTDTNYSITVPIEFIKSEEDLGKEIRQFKTYITPDLIGDNQPLLQDEITLTFSGSSRGCKITNILTQKGGQEYLFRVDVIF